MTKKTTTEQLNHVEASLRRWHTRLKIASNKIEKLVKRRRSLMLKLAGLPAETKRLDLKEQVATLGADSLLPDFVARGQAAQKAVDDLVIPPMLRRTMEDRNIDQLAERTAALPEGSLKKSQQERLKRMEEKRRGRSMFAKSDMPLTGKDALKAIRGKK